MTMRLDTKRPTCLSCLLILTFFVFLNDVPRDEEEEEDGG